MQGDTEMKQAIGQIKNSIDTTKDKLGQLAQKIADLVTKSNGNPTIDLTGDMKDLFTDAQQLQVAMPNIPDEVVNPPAPVVVPSVDPVQQSRQ